MSSDAVWTAPLVVIAGLRCPGSDVMATASAIWLPASPGSLAQLAATKRAAITPTVPRGRIELPCVGASQLTGAGPGG